MSVSKGDFVISVKVIVTTAATCILMFIGVVFKNWTESEKKFKDDVLQELKETNEILYGIKTSAAVQEQILNTHTTTIKEHADKFTAMRKAMTSAGIILID